VATAFVRDLATASGELLTECTQAIRRNPNDAAAYVRRGQLYYQKDDNERAIADFTAASKLDANNAWISLFRARALAEKHEPTSGKRFVLIPRPPAPTGARDWCI
jgi:predicted Zn-dependent protease